MIKFSYLLIISIMLTFLVIVSCREERRSNWENDISIPFDSTLVDQFVKFHPAIGNYQKDLVAFYRNNGFRYIWLDQVGIVEYGHSLYSKVKEIEEEGISFLFPYQEKLDNVFIYKNQNMLNSIDIELMITSLYLFYADQVYKGIRDENTTDIGWFLPRKTVSYANLLDSIVADQTIQSEDSMVLFSQYYKLRDVLKRYRDIEQQGGWITIEPDPEIKSYKTDDTAKAIRQIRDRLFITGDIVQNNGSNRYDTVLLAGIKKYQLRNGFHTNPLISKALIQEMNVPVGERIKTIVVNMERCRWLSPEIFTSSEYIFVNIPSYNLKMIRDNKIEFDSRVVVGKSMTKTVIFGGKISYIVFSPYWNLPQSIIDDEVKPGMIKDTNYLASRNMEWNNGLVRQRPGKNNSLGLVKFMFPNSNEIYLHDTPSKGLFRKENRAFSHGCVRVENARELAIIILKDDEYWTPITIDAAMHAGEERNCQLENEIPVHIGYFTSWVDESGEINFYKDTYKRDERLAMLLFYRE